VLADLGMSDDRRLNAALEITYPPTKVPWGVRETHVRHPDGHVLAQREIAGFVLFTLAALDA
jgi:hypothetical protein